MSFQIILLVVVVCLGQASAFFHHNRAFQYIVKVQMADVEITFPNNKKTKVAAGSSLKDAAKKAGFSPNYGCEEGSCSS